MLSKLLKYEIYATARIFLPLYMALLIFAGINKLITSISPSSWDAPAVISMIIYISILVGLFVMTFVVIIQRFYKNLLSDEGYLMFTLPTSSWQHIISKLAISLLWMILSIIISIASIFIIAYSENLSAILNQIFINIGKFYFAFGSSAYLLTLELIIGGIIYLALGTLIIYCAITIYHLLNRHRLLASIGAFIGLSTIVQTLFINAPRVNNNIQIKDFNSFFNIEIIKSMNKVLLLNGILIPFILCAAFFYGTNYILRRRLNLE